MKNFFIKYRDFAGVLIGLVIILMPLVSLAANLPNSYPTSPTNSNPTSPSNSNPTAGSYSNAGSFQLVNPLKFNSVCGLVTGIVDAATVIGIPIAILFVVWAGFKFVWAQGNGEALADARRNFLNVIIGIAIFISASLIAHVIMNTLQALGAQGINSCS